MTVRETIDLGNGHLIEIGEATWDPSETSVRYRWANGTGGEGPGDSGEMALANLGSLLAAVAQRDLLDAREAARLIEILAASLERRLAKPAVPSLQPLLDRVTEDNRHAEVETGPPVGNEAW